MKTALIRHVMKFVHFIAGRLSSSAPYSATFPVLSMTADPNPIALLFLFFEVSLLMVICDM